MNHALSAAAADLAEILGHENAALAALDLARAGAMVDAKRRAAAAFAAAHARLVAAGATPDGVWREQLHRVGEHLRALSLDNKRLLERALLVQGQVVGVLAQAARSVGAQAPRYGAAGTLVDAGRAVPMAVSANF